MTADFMDLAQKVDKFTKLYLDTPPPRPGSASASVYSMASFLRGLSHGVEKVQPVPTPLPPFTGPIDVADFAVFQTLEWITNQTDPVCIQRAGQVCVELLDNLNAALFEGAFSFFYQCSSKSGSSWTTCPVQWTEGDADPYIGVRSPIYEICSQMKAISPSFFESD